LLIVLDDALGANLRFVRVLTGRTARSPLTKQVPALIEVDLDSPHPVELLLRKAAPDVRLLEAVFLVDEPSDSVNDFIVIHDLAPSFRNRPRTVPELPRQTGRPAGTTE
jgi:hypothetical protein